MASVTNNMTRIHDAEGTLTAGNIPSGGAGATANTDIFLQGSQSLGKRITVTASTEGFALVDAADNDCSASGTHVGMWIWITHYSIMDDLRVSLSTGTTPSTNYDYHTVPLSEFPALGGWKRVWVHVNRTPSGTAGSGLTESQVRCYGVQVSFSSGPGGSAANLMLDAADYVTGPALTLTGTSGVWTDFTTSDENSTNQYGVMRNVGGVYNLFARVKLGTSGSSLAFTDSNFAVVYPVQSLVQSTWMGIDVSLEHASTAISWTNGVIKSVSTSGNQGDLSVVGTSGTLTATGMTMASLRAVTLTSVCSFTNSSFISCGQITAPGSTLTGNKYSGYEGTTDSAYLVWDVNTDTDGKLDSSSFTKGTAATHAIELGTSSPTSVTLRNIAFSGYNASNAQNDSTILVSRTTGTVTISLVGCSGNISYKSAGATVTLVVDPVTTQVTVRDVDTGSVIQNARVLLKTADGTGPMPYQKSTTITRSGATATASCTGHGLVTNDYVVIKGATQQEYNGVFQVTVSDANTFTYTVTGTPATPATGTITTTGAPLYGLTNAFGILSATRSFTTSQPITGWVRKSSSADNPKYKTSTVGGTISNTTGFSTTIQMIPDQ